MKTSDVDILIIPDRGDAPADHWQSRWVRNLKTARRIEQEEWHRPAENAWADRIFAVARDQRRPAVLVAHGCGVLAVAQAAERLGATSVVGAFLVAPADPDGLPEPARNAFGEIPAGSMPWPGLVIASTNDPHCALERARVLAHDWGASFTDAGAVGHIDVASGHGPWPEGLLRFGQFLRDLG